MKKAQLFVLIALVVLWPSSAFAGRSIWGWLEEMSGPGPFRGFDLTTTLLCDYGSGLGRCWNFPKEVTERNATRPITRRLAIKIGRFTSYEGSPRFQDLSATDPENQGRVRVAPISVLYMFRWGPLDFGPGMGFWSVSSVSGADFPTFHKLVLTPTVGAFSPLTLVERWRNKEWARFVRLEIDTSFVPRGFKGPDFGNNKTRFDSGPEFLTRGAVVVDLGTLMSAVK